jgi:hypothetical protein
MALSQILDITEDFNNGNQATLDIGGYDYAIVQLVAPTGTVTFKTSNDANAITGASDGSAVSADNFTVVQGINLATSAAGSTLAATGLIRFGYIGKFLQIDGGGSATCDKVILRLFKIN